MTSRKNVKQKGRPESSNVIFVPHGVSDAYVENAGVPFEYLTQEFVSCLLSPRIVNAHKGTYGHVLLVCGSRGMMGAATLATGAALRSGCGLVTAHVPENYRIPVEVNNPSALISLDPAAWFSTLPENLEKYNSVGIGCGIGQHIETKKALATLMAKCRDKGVPMILDADALNIIAANRELRAKVPAEAILTPHDGELKRLTGEWGSEEKKYDLIRRLASELNCIVVAKGPNTAVCDSGNSFWFNSTGNSGMAKGGSGDVLTGFIAGLLARGYEPADAARIGVFLHGFAGDKARDYFGEEAMNSSDIVDFLGDAFNEVQ